MARFAVAGLALSLALPPTCARAAEGDESETQASLDRWPLAYVRRPQTLLQDMIEADVTVGFVHPNEVRNVDPRDLVVYDFHSYLRAGSNLSVGITDRLQAGISVPRILCFDSGEPSGCSAQNRYGGAGVAVAYGILRVARVQAEVDTAFDIASSSPVSYDWKANVGVKVLATDKIAINFDVSVSRVIDGPATLPPPYFYTYVNGGVDLQLTERLLVFAHPELWAPPSQLSEGVALEVYGGLSFTFNRHVQASLAAGNHNLLAEPRWYGSNVPESFADLAVAFWHY